MGRSPNCFILTHHIFTRIEPAFFLNLLFYICRFCVEATAKLCFSFFSVPLKILFLLLLSLEISFVRCSLLFHPILDITSFQDGIYSIRTEPATITTKLYFTLKSAYCDILQAYACFFQYEVNFWRGTLDYFSFKEEETFLIILAKEPSTIIVLSFFLIKYWNKK